MVFGGLKLIFNDDFAARIDVASFDIAGERSDRRSRFDEFKLQAESLAQCR